MRPVTLEEITVYAEVRKSHGARLCGGQTMDVPGV